MSPSTLVQDKMLIIDFLLKLGFPLTSTSY